MKEIQLSGRQISSSEMERYDLDGKGVEWIKEQTQVPALVDTGEGWKCQRCGSNQEKDFYPLGSDRVYCLHCFLLGRLTNTDYLYRIPALEPIDSLKEKTYLTWQGTLSTQQEEASKDLVDSLKQTDKIHIIQAVTGAGKTEMIFGVIDKVLGQGGRVAIVSPRVDVCLELGPRIQKAFEGVDLQILHGQMNEPPRYSPLVISTNHQVWRFYQAFDLIIVDEVDAFPLVGDEGLHYGVQKALKSSGKLVYLTATPDRYLARLLATGQATSTVLPARFHQHPLPVPKFIWLGEWSHQIVERRKGRVLTQITKFLNLEGVKLIFMPDIRLAESLGEWMQELYPNQKIEVVHSKDPHRIEKVQALRKRQLDCLVTTTILERGVTFVNCQVLIIGAEHSSFTTSALIQMSGRVGRNPKFPSGVLLYGHFGRSLSMVRARREIQYMNRLAKEKGLLHER